MKKIFLACCSPLFAGIVLFAITSTLRAQSDSLVPSNDLATGHSYFGIDAGITGSEYLGEHNFLWGIVTDPSLATYLPFSNLGTGIGFVGGIKAGFALARWIDLEAKLRFMTNHTSRTESTPEIYLDTLYPNAQAPASSTYSITLSSIDAELLGHIRINDWLYGALGGSASQFTKNGFSASQHLAGSYIRLTTHTVANISDQQQAEEQIDNWFYATRFDAQVGFGGVYRIGASNMLLDAELLVSIPFTQWLTKLADSSLNTTAARWLQPPITDPHLWYATLTVGLRLPFHTLPPPIPDIAVLPPPAMHVKQAPAVVEKSGAVVLSGNVTDAVTGQPLSATLTTVNLGNNQVIVSSHTDSNGNYRIEVAKPGKYSVTANAAGHLFGTAYFEVDSAGRILNNPQTISLASSSNGKTRLLVFFEFDKADLQPASAPELNRAVDLMMNVPTMKVEIAGYSDSIGALQHNLDLSLRRANAVRDFLVQHGVAPNRITAQGYGPASPIATNTTDEGRAANRRVEFVVKP